MLIGRMLTETRLQSPDKIALWFGEQSWTYAELDDSTNRIAASLSAAGVRTGDRVALFMPNCPELVQSYFACFKLGAIVVPLNYRYRQPEVKFALEHSGSTSLIVHQTLAGELTGLPLTTMGIRRCYLVAGEATPPFQPFESLLGTKSKVSAPTFGEDQLAAILYTSGSTARPKGVTYSHSSLSSNCTIQSDTFEFTPDDVHLISTAACHAAAFTGQLLPNIYMGGVSILTHLPTPAQVVDEIARRGVTRVQMLPASLEDLVEFLESNPGSNLASWRACTVGGDVVPLELHHRFQKVTGFELSELFGMTEVLSCITNPPFGVKKAGSIGKPVAQTDVRIVDNHDQEVPTGSTGQLLVRSPAMLVGYWNDPSATAQALRGDWMHTGDLARCDEDGYYWFVCRQKEIIIRGGSNIAPLEVEEVLDEHPAVHLSCVLGIPDAHLGEIVGAYVSFREGVTAPSTDELQKFVASRLAAYKIPERITVLSELPLNPTGKVDRKKLHALVGSK